MEREDGRTELALGRARAEGIISGGSGRGRPQQRRSGQAQRGQRRCGVGTASHAERIRLAALFFALGGRACITRQVVVALRMLRVRSMRLVIMQ
jgi:hypothetical protein